jgi:hypothetical protein
MGKSFYFFLGLVVATSAFAADAVDEEKPHARVCLSIYEPGPPEKEEAFQISTAAGAAKTVRAYVDASDKCTVLVAALTKDGKLVNGWRPQLSDVPAEFEEIRAFRSLRFVPRAGFQGNRGSEEARRCDAEPESRRSRPRAPNGEVKGTDRPDRKRQGKE